MRNTDTGIREFKGDLIAGVDIGGTNTAVGIVGEEGRLLSRSAFPTTDHGTAAEFVRHLAKTIRQLVSELPLPHVCAAWAWRRRRPTGAQAWWRARQISGGEP